MKYVLNKFKKYVLPLPVLPILQKAQNAQKAVKMKSCVRPKLLVMENQTNFQNMPDPKKKEFGKAYPLKSNKMYVDQGSITIHACVHIFLFFQFLPVCTTSLGSL